MSATNENATDDRAQLIALLDRLPPKLLSTVSDFVSFLIARSQLPTSESSVSKAVLPVENDPIVGLIEGPPNLATDAEEIL